MAGNITYSIGMDVISTFNGKGFKQASKSLTDLQKQAALSNKVMSAVGQLRNVDKFKEKLKGVGLEYSDISKKGRGYEIVAQKIYEAEKNREQMNKRIVSSQQSVKDSFWSMNRALGSLSILFMGQMIAAAMERMATASITSFMKISQGQGEASKAMTVLTAQMEYLKFTFGNAIATALIPMLPAIINIVEAISEFIQEHPKLVSMGFAFGFIFVRVAALAANIILLIAGIRSMLGFGTHTYLEKVGIKALEAQYGIGQVANTTKTKFIPGMSIATALSLLFIAALVTGLIMMAKYPALQTETKKGWEGLKTTLQLVIADFLSIFGLTIQQEDAFIALGAITDVFVGGFLTGISFMANALRNLITIINTMLDPLRNFAEGISDIMSGNFLSAAGNFGNAIFNIDGIERLVTEIPKNFQDAWNNIPTLDFNIADNIAAAKAQRDAAMVDSNQKVLEEIKKSSNMVSSIYPTSNIPGTNIQMSEGFSKKLSEASKVDPELQSILSLQNIDDSSLLSQNFNNLNDTFSIMANETAVSLNEKLASQSDIVNTLGINHAAVNDEVDYINTITDDTINKAKTRIGVTEDEAEAMLKMAKNTERAAKAQERLNRAGKGADGGSSRTGSGET